MTTIKGHVEHGRWSRAAISASFLCCLLLTEASAWSADPAWSPSGDAAIGETVSSILDDQWGTPDDHGPGQLLSGSTWTSRHSWNTNQWIILDLGQERVVYGIRTKGYDHDPSSHWQSGKSPKDMELQSGATISGPWDTRSSFQGIEGNDRWTTSMLSQPHSARYWRLWIVNNWGAHDYVSMQGLELLLEPDGNTAMLNVIIVAGAVVGLCFLAGVSFRYCRTQAETAERHEDEEQGGASKEVPSQGGEVSWNYDEQGGAGVAVEDEAHPDRQRPSKADLEKAGTSSDLPVAVAVPVHDISVVRVAPAPTEPEV